MFSKSDRVFADLSSEVSDIDDWDVGVLRQLSFHLDCVAFSYEPVSGLFAVGTSHGTLLVMGGPGAQMELTLPNPAPLRIKFVLFKYCAGLKLMCIDQDDRLHSWDLSVAGKPRLQLTTSLDSGINSVTLSPSHSHAFMALQSGDIITYDLLCSRISPYKISNRWKIYVEQVGAGQKLDISKLVAVDVIIHPRDLNLLILAYAGGIILYDLMQQHVVGTYELAIPAGAPGGGGYESPDLLTLRHPSVTAVTVHPAGHFFAVGYNDGSIAFWAFQDEDRPLLVRTVDDIDTNVLDAAKLDAYLPDSGRPGGTASAYGTPPREPIYKLTWCGFSNSADPRGGDTALVILGGLEADSTPGVTMHWLPAFNPPEPTITSNTRAGGLHPEMREDMRASLFPIETVFYSTLKEAQDFLVVPKDNPHFGLAFDPTSLLILTDSFEGTRFEGLEFPPSRLLTGPQAVSVASKTPTGGDDVEQGLADIIDEMLNIDDLIRVDLPSPLWSIRGVDVMTLTRDAHTGITTALEQLDANPESISFHGGATWAADDVAQESKIAKFATRRIMISHHVDSTIHFQDISPQLLISTPTEPMQKDFPYPLSGLSIDIAPILVDATVISQAPNMIARSPMITSVQLAPESRECAVALSTGDVLVFKKSSGSPQPEARKVDDPELLMIDHISNPLPRLFSPYCVVLSRGEVTCFAQSDIGFLAVAYADRSLTIVDLRGPTVIFRLGHNIPPPKSNKRSTILGKPAPDVIKALTWCFCGISKDLNFRMRLIAIRGSGAVNVITVQRAETGGWAATMEDDHPEAPSHVLPSGSFVIESRKGGSMKPDRERLAMVYSAGAKIPVREGHCFWVVAGVKGAKCFADVTGDRVGKTEWKDTEGVVKNVQIVERHSAHALVVVTDKNEAMVYGLPRLNFKHSLSLPASDDPISIDASGDFIAITRHPQSDLVTGITLGSLFSGRRKTLYKPPIIDWTAGRKQVPLQPQPVSMAPPSMLSLGGSWFGFGRGVNGDKIDALLAGPDRPVPKQPEPPAVVVTSRPTSVMSRRSSFLSRRSSATSSTMGQIRTDSRAGSRASVYDRLSNALNERGQALGGLEDSFNSLQNGSKTMADSAKKLAAKQGAKSWFGI